MRLGDHGRTVIMAVPPTAHAMSGIHQQHDPVDVKSLGDAIHFAAHRCARAESVRGDCAVSASDWTRAPRPNAWTLLPRSTRRPSPRTGGPTSTRSRAVTRQVRGSAGPSSRHPPGDRPSRLPRSLQAALLVGTVTNPSLPRTVSQQWICAVSLCSSPLVHDQ